MAKVILDFDPDKDVRLHCEVCGYDAPNPINLIPAAIGTPCPACGANMLTASDFEKTMEMIKALNILFGPAIGREPSGGGTPLRIGIHGDTVTMQTGDGNADQAAQ